MTRNELVLLYARLQWRIFPVYEATGVNKCACKDPMCQTPGKHPRISNWQEQASCEPDVIMGWLTDWPNMNIGIVGGGPLWFLDIDAKSDGPESLASLERQYGELPHTPVSLTGSGNGSCHLVFAGHPGIRNRANIAPGIDVRGEGGYIVAPPSRHASGEMYHWEITSMPDDVPLAPAPGWLLDMVLAPAEESEAWQPPTTTVLEGSRNDTLFRMASSFKAQGFPDDTVRSLVTAFNNDHVSPPVATGELELILASVARYEQGEGALATLEVGPAPSPTLQPEPQTRDDHGNYLRFKENCPDQFYRIEEHNAWYVWYTHHYKYFKNPPFAEVSHYLQKLIKQEADCMWDEERASLTHQWGNKCRSFSRVKAATAMVGSDPRLCLSPYDFDQHDLLLNVQNGVLDLETGTLHEHHPSYRFTACSSTPYDPNATCPTWLKFLDAIFADNPHLIPFVQLIAGYSATGLMSEHLMVVCHGRGRNGKSTLIKTICQVLGIGQFAFTLPHAVLVRSQSQNDQSNVIMDSLASSWAKRMASCIETETSSILNEGMVKAITGDDAVAAKRMYGGVFTFDPKFKIWLATNHKPEIRGQDDGIWSRIALIPFNQQFKGADADKQLGRKLMAERSGILNWLVEGVQRVLREGIEFPREVSQAVDAYRAEMDYLGEFINEYTTPGGPYDTIAKDQLFQCWKQYCQDENIKPGSKKRLGIQLIDRGWTEYRERTGRRTWEGQKLIKNLNEITF